MAKIKDISIGDFRYVTEAASIGKNRGNRFTITLRGLRSNNPESSIEVLRSRLDETVASLRTAGYLNYYGLQRFGNRGYNITIGCHMLRSEWESAVLAILESSGKVETEILRNYVNRSDFCQLRSRTFPPNILYRYHRIT